MKLLLFVLLGGVKAVLAGGTGDSGCCKFTLESSGPFACPAGELPDGQLRLNGTYDTATFCIGPDGGITDSNGFGCIVTGRFLRKSESNLGLRFLTSKQKPQSHRSNAIKVRSQTRASPSTLTICSSTMARQISPPALPPILSGTSTSLRTLAKRNARPSL